MPLIGLVLVVVLSVLVVAGVWFGGRRSRRLRDARWASLVLVAVVAGPLIWALWGGGPRAWLDPDVRPVAVDRHWERTDWNEWCEPYVEGAIDQLCATYIGPWSPEWDETFGGSAAEYDRILTMTDCSELDEVVDQADVDIVRWIQEGRGDNRIAHSYLFAANRRQNELGCFAN